MAYPLSSSRQKALTTAQEFFRMANLHPSSAEFRLKCLNDYGFYDGTGQWEAHDLRILQERGQLPITVNICKGFIDNLSGVEIQSRYRIACRNDSQNPEDDALADALTHLLFHIQENQEIPYKGSLKFRDSLICGLGWSYLYQEDGVVSYDYVHPFNMLPDPDDLTPQYTAMKYVCRKRWMRPDRVKARWPHTAKDIDFSGDFGYYQGMESPELMDREALYTDPNLGNGTNRSRVLVVEVQYKVPAKIYRGLDTQGRSFETFQLEKAESLAGSEKNLEEVQGERLMRTLFLDNTLLEHAPLDATFPDQKDFSYIPIVFQRRFKTGVPYGLLESMKDIQRDCNVRVTKSVYAINSARVVFEGNPMPGRDIETIRKELKIADSVILLPKDSKFQVSSNSQLGEEQLKIVELYLNLIQRVTGIYDEMLGIPTNATSGIAQNIRQVNSVRNNVFAFDNFSQMKKREARFLLTLLQAGGEENLAVEILNPEERKRIILNLTRIIDGKPVVFNDIRTLPLSLYVEEVPDYQSSFAEQKATFESLLSNAHAQWLMSSPELLRRLGVRDPETVAKEMQAAMQQKTMMEQGVAGRGQPMQFPGQSSHPQQPSIPQTPGVP
ncbi:hypothetical protein [Candidatus Finniella inopinata]|uniref:Phage portal protein n=1 Tax=Candidatus Finniella inopinata TaxID=1696036 RepID=A0A4Q7DNX9_9PROT|nr:hypothetical protein [Candidatus Finniella inopinata]RZI46646.1 hypothetical protein EQU50_03410 [Candidatus Finniella inopinata]